MPLMTIRAMTCLLALSATACGDLQLVQSGPLPLSAARPIAIPVEPGDVIHITTWVAGLPQGSNQRPPEVETTRLAIRALANDRTSPEGVARSTMLPEEAAFLGNILATRRENYVDTPAAEPPLAKQLDEQKNTLWNALIASLVFVKNQPDGHGQIQVRALEDEKDEDGKYPLSAFCANVAALDKVAAFLQVCKLDDDGLPTDTDHLAETRTFEPHAKMLAPVTIRRATTAYGNYSTEELVVAASGQLERSAVAIGGTTGIEARWSLAAWEVSGICQGGPSEGRAPWTIQRVRLRTPSGERQLRVVDTDVTPEFAIAIEGVDESSGAALAIGDRRVTRDKEGRRGTLARGALAYLYPADLRWIQWRDNRGTVRPSKMAPEVRAMCVIARETR